MKIDCDGYGLNTYFFEKSNEYIFSCVDGNNHFLMKRINLDELKKILVSDNVEYYLYEKNYYYKY